MTAEGEQKHEVSFKNRFLATRMVFESILFEKELSSPKSESWKKGPLGLAVLVLVCSVFLWQWKARQGDVFNAAEAARVNMVQKYQTAVETLGPQALLGSGALQAGAAQPPFYYLTFLPVLKFVTPDIGSAVFLVNAFYLAFLLGSVYYALRRHRNAVTALSAAVATAALPFVMGAARSLSPQIATLAFTAAFWAFYLNSDDFELPRPVFWMGLMFSFGMLTDKFFWVYTLPLLPMMGAVAMGHLHRAELFKGLLPGIVAGVPWYLMNLVSFYNGWLTRSFPGADLSHLEKFFWLLKAAAAEMHLPLFILGGLAMLWMYYSVFMPYQGKEKVALWFVVPYLFFTLTGMRAPELLYPALLPFGIAMGVMTPSKLRYPGALLAVLLLVLNASGLVAPRYLPGIKLAPLFGGTVVMRGDDFSGKFVETVRAVLAGRSSAVVCLTGTSEYLNRDTLSVMLERRELQGIRVVEAGPELASVCDVLALTPSASPKAASETSRIKASPWLPAAFAEAGTVVTPGGATELYSKRRILPGGGKPGRFFYPSLSLAGLTLRDAVITADVFDEKSGRYPKADISAVYASFGELDIHGFSATVANFALMPGEKGPVILSASPVLLTDGKIPDYSVGRFLESLDFPVKNLDLRFDDGIFLSGTMGGKAVGAELDLSLKNSVLVLRPRSVTYGDAEFNPKYVPLLNFSFDLAALPIEVHVKSLKVQASMLEIR